METEYQYTEEDFEFVLEILNDYAEQTLNKREFHGWIFQEIRYFDGFYHLFFENSWTISDSVMFEFDGPLFDEESLSEKWFTKAIEAIQDWENEMIF